MIRNVIGSYYPIYQFMKSLIQNGVPVVWRLNTPKLGKFLGDNHVKMSHDCFSDMNLFWFVDALG